MSSPMRRVNEVASASIGNYLTNYKSWNPVAYNVLEYGLIGDGVTDNTAALQKLIDLAISEGRKAIYFPHGEYYVTSLINADQVVFFGDNASFIGGYTGTIYQMGDWATNAQLADIAIINVSAYGVVGSGLVDDTAALQAAYTAANGKRLEIPSEFNCLITGQITMPADIIINCKGQITCSGDADYWFYADNPNSIVIEQIKITVTEPFANRSLLNRVIRCDSPTYFEVMTAEIIGASTAIHCLNGDDFVCGTILLKNVYGTDAQYGYGVNSSAKRTKVASLTVENDDTTHGRHAFYINGSQWEDVDIGNIYVRNWNKNPVNIINEDIDADCYFHIGNAVFVNANMQPFNTLTGCIHAADTNGPGVRMWVDDLRVRGIAGAAISTRGSGSNNGAYIGYLYAESLANGYETNTYLVHFRGGANVRVGKVLCDTLPTNWLAAVLIRDTAGAQVDDVYVGGGVGGSAAVRIQDADVILGAIRAEGITKILDAGGNTVKYKQLRQTINYGTAPPSTGSWVRGDIVWHSAPLAGGPVGWVCVATGTPGTWLPFGQSGVLNSIASTPSFTGQIAISGGNAYIAVGTSGTGDWKQISN